MRASVLVVVALAACQPGRSAVLVTVGADPPVAGVRALRVVVEKDGRASQPESLPMPDGVDAIPPEQTFSLTLGREHQGSALLRVAALDANGASIVEGTAPVTLTPGEPTTARVTLGVDVPIPGPDGGTNDMRQGGVTVTGVARLIGLTDHSGVTATLTPGGYTTTTLADGSYTLANIPVGAYTLTFEKGPYWERVPDFQVSDTGSGLATDGGLAPVTPLEIPRATRLVTRSDIRNVLFERLRSGDIVLQAFGKTEIDAPLHFVIPRKQSFELSPLAAYGEFGTDEHAVYFVDNTASMRELKRFDVIAKTISQTIAAGVFNVMVAQNGKVFFLNDYDAQDGTKSLRVSDNGAAPELIATRLRLDSGEPSADATAVFFRSGSALKRVNVATGAVDTLASTAPGTTVDAAVQSVAGGYFWFADRDANQLWTLKRADAATAPVVSVAAQVSALIPVGNDSALVVYQCASGRCVLGRYVKNFGLDMVDSAVWQDSLVIDAGRYVYVSGQTSPALKTVNPSNGVSVTVGASCDGIYDSSDDGQSVVWVEADHRTVKSSAWTGGSVKTIATGSDIWAAGFSADGKWVLYQSVNSAAVSQYDRFDVNIVPSTGGTPTPVATLCMFGSFTRDTKFVIALCQGTGGKRAIKRFELPNGPLTVVDDSLDDVPGSQFVFSPDGAWIAYQARIGTTVFAKAVSVATGSVSVLGSVPNLLSFLGSTGSDLLYSVNRVGAEEDVKIRTLGTGAEIDFGRTQRAYLNADKTYLDTLGVGVSSNGGDLTILSVVSRTHARMLSGVEQFERRGSDLIAVRGTGFNFQKGVYLVASP